MNFHYVFYLLILRCKITSDASSLRDFLLLIPHANHKMNFFSFPTKAALLIDFYVLQVSSCIIYFYWFVNSYSLSRVHH